jgi:hypothetical protein
MSRALVLIGSPKPDASASRTFAEALAQRITANGVPADLERISPALVRNTERLESQLAQIASAELIVICAPVYVDTIPGHVTALLEAWAAAARTPGHALASGTRRFAYMTQCGFPESAHTLVACRVARRFAEKTPHVSWSGAIGFGMGGGLEGSTVERSPFAGKAGALDDAAAALAKPGGIVPQSSIDAFEKDVVPAWVYPVAGWFMWNSRARREGCEKPLTYAPYAD